MQHWVTPGVASQELKPLRRRLTDEAVTVFGSEGKRAEWAEWALSKSKGSRNQQILPWHIALNLRRLEEAVEHSKF